MSERYTGAHDSVAVNEMADACEMLERYVGWEIKAETHLMAQPALGYTGNKGRGPIEGEERKKLYRLVHKMQLERSRTELIPLKEPWRAVSNGYTVEDARNQLTKLQTLFSELLRYSKKEETADILTTWKQWDAFHTFVRTTSSSASEI